MSDLHKAAQQALEAGTDGTSHHKAIETITTLRAALAGPVEPVKHKHQWFSTGAMEPGEMRCIHCGAWAKEKNT
jgi:hypothetical protein